METEDNAALRELDGQERGGKGRVVTEIACE